MSRENPQQLCKRCKGPLLDRCVERLLHTMISRDESGIDASHCLSAGVRLEPLIDQTRSPLRSPTVVGGRVRKQGPHVGVSFLIRGSVTQPTESQWEDRAVLVHRSEKGVDALEIVFFIVGESELVLHPGKPMFLKPGGKP